jgi:hypothetical protein
MGDAMLKISWVLAVMVWSLSVPAAAQQGSDASAHSPGRQLVLGRAVICEDVRAEKPYNPGVVFSIELGQVYCFTTFDVVPGKTQIYHNWYRRDRPSRKIRLNLKPPRWSIFSRMQLRAEDKGPWSVEITDPEGKVLKVLRFSITD